MYLVALVNIHQGKNISIKKGFLASLIILET